MALHDLVQEAIEHHRGNEILRLLGWGMLEAMRRRVANYRTSGNIRELEEAITLPQNRRNKILTYVSEHGISDIDSWLAQLGIITREQLNTFSLNMCAYTQDLYDRQQLGEDPADLALDIETNIINPADYYTDLLFPYSLGYTDLYGR